MKFNGRKFNSVLFIVLVFPISHFFTEIPASANPLALCTKCSGLGRYFKGFRTVKCDRCGGDGQTDQSLSDQLGLNHGSGYQTNKFDLKYKVEEGGWIVAWSDDISETDALNGLVAGGLSIYTANPAPFYAWAEMLVERTSTTLLASGKNKIPGELTNQLKNLIVDVVRNSIQGKDAREVFRNYGTFDFKAGAIRYAGRNYVGNTTISTTWGLKPYVAIRWRIPGQGISQPSSPPSSSTPIPNYSAEYSFVFPYTRNDGVQGVVYERFYSMSNGRWIRHRYYDFNDGVTFPTQKLMFEEYNRKAGGVALRNIQENVDISLEDGFLYVKRPNQFGSLEWVQETGRGEWLAGKP